MGYPPLLHQALTKSWSRSEAAETEPTPRGIPVFQVVDAHTVLKHQSLLFCFQNKELNKNEKIYKVLLITLPEDHSVGSVVVY